jgi:hypothetical protein
MAAVLITVLGAPPQGGGYRATLGPGQRAVIELLMLFTEPRPSTVPY